jgi:hypothetical protein
MNRRLLLVVFCVVVSGAAPPQPDPATLVRGLEDDAFAAREQTTARLLRMGEAAIPALRRGLMSRDPEVRRRCAELLRRLDQTDEERQMSAFLNGANLPLPLWDRFRALAGDDREARMLYLEIHRSRPNFLERLSREPDAVSNELWGRINSLLRIRMRFGDALPPELLPAPPEIASVVLCISVTEGRPERMERLFYLLTLKEIGPVVRNHPGLRRLLCGCLAQQATDPDRCVPAAKIARRLGFDELINQTYWPLARKRLETALAAPVNVHRLYDAAALIQEIGACERLPSYLRKRLGILVDQALFLPLDSAALSRLVDVVRVLEQEQILHETIEPGLLRLINAEDGDRMTLDDFSVIEQLCIRLAVTVPAETLDRLACRLIEKEMEHFTEISDLRDLSQIRSLIQSRSLSGARDGLLRPRIRQRALALLEQPDDLKRLGLVLYLNTHFALELAKETLRTPYLRLVDQELAKGASFPLLTRLYQMAGDVGVPEEVNDRFREVLRRSLDPETMLEESQLELIHKLRVREGVPLLLRVARTKAQDATHRGKAILIVGALGTSEQVAQLEPLLDDTTSVIGGRLFDRYVEIRDVTLVALIHHSGLKLSDYGFPAVDDLNALTLDEIAEISRTPAQRAEALARWKKWRAEHRK